MAPKNRRGSGGPGKKKLSKMTEEERIVYLEQKMLAEEEMKKKKEDMLAQFLKDKLHKEEKATRYNMNRLNHQFRTMMRTSKSKELTKDIEILSQTFERVVDRKDSVIKSLVKDLEEAEEQYCMALRSHLQNVDHLITLQNQRLEKLEKEYVNELESLQLEFEEEQESMKSLHEQEMTDLADILFAMEQNVGERENEAKAEFQSLRDEIKNKNLEEKHALRVQLETQVEQLWTQFQAAMKNYQEGTEERKNAFEALKSKDDRSAHEIETQMRKLQRIADSIAQLKSKMGQNARECEERNRHLQDERGKMLSHFQDLKAQMNKARGEERRKLTKLTKESNGAINELNHLKEQGQAILRLAEHCRKLMTEEEKVLPFYATSLSPEEEDDIKQAIADAPGEPLAKIMHEYEELEPFWKRYNKVLLDKVTLDKERQVLLQENGQLRSLLKQYLDGISVNEEILSKVNPLLVVNHKTNVRSNAGAMTDPRLRPRPVTRVVVEAATAIKHTL